MSNTYYNTEFAINLMEHDEVIKLRKELRNHKIFSCLILKDSNLILEYYSNKKISQNLQKINSCTKSYMNALIGIAFDKGLIKDVHVPISEFFGDTLIKDPDLRKWDITLYHLLTMSAGFDWPEFGEWNCFSPMVYSRDIIDFILSRKLAAVPGEKMNYNSGCSHLLGAIIQKSAGCTVAEYAEEVLFRPLGIEEYKWYDNQGQCLTADGLRLKTVDMLKFGYLYLNGGIYKRKEILSSPWIDESTKPLYRTYANIGSYGYHWWVSSLKIDNQEDIPFYFALGYMGQFIIVVPKYQMVIAMTGNLENSLRPLEIIKSYIIPLSEAVNNCV